MAKKQKLSECCNAVMLGGVQCENCGSNGKFTTGTAIVKRLDIIINCLEDKKQSVTVQVKLKETESRFIDCGDGTIKDTKTKLMWQKEGSKEELTWEKAKEYCDKSSLAGHNDWRMPRIEELFSLIDFERKEPAINPIFSCESARYWSSIVYAPLTDLAWSVYFYDGYVVDGFRDHSYYVRPVRQY
jgi:hypothetical protein